MQYKYHSKPQLMDIVKSDGAALKYATPELKADKEVVMAAVGYNGFALFQADESLLTDKDLSLEAVIKNSRVFNYIHEDHKSDSELIKEMVYGNYHVFSDLDEPFTSDREIALFVVSKNGEYYKYIHSSLRNDREIAKTAIENQRKGCVLGMLSEEFRNDLDLVLLSAKGYPMSVFDCGTELIGKIRWVDSLKAIEVLTLTKELSLKDNLAPEKRKVMKI